MSFFFIHYLPIIIENDFSAYKFRSEERSNQSYLSNLLQICLRLLNPVMSQNDWFVRCDSSHMTQYT